MLISEIRYLLILLFDTTVFLITINFGRSETMILNSVIQQIRQLKKIVFPHIWSKWLLENNKVCGYKTLKMEDETWKKCCLMTDI